MQGTWRRKEIENVHLYDSRVMLQIFVDYMGGMSIRKCNDNKGKCVWCSTHLSLAFHLRLTFLVTYFACACQFGDVFWSSHLQFILLVFFFFGFIAG